MVQHMVIDYMKHDIIYIKRLTTQHTKKLIFGDFRSRNIFDHVFAFFGVADFRVAHFVFSTDRGKCNINDTKIDDAKKCKNGIKNIFKIIFRYLKSQKIQFLMWVVTSH